MKYIHTPHAPAVVGPYSQGVISGGMLYTAGQIGLTPDGKLVNDSVQAETRQILANLQAILAAAGCDFTNVVHVKIYIKDADLFSEVNKVYAEYFSAEQKPARECVVAAPPLADARIEISMIAELQP